MRKGQKKKSRKVVRKTVRFTEVEWHRLRWIAETYAGGNVARWLRHGAFEAERRYLKK
jgi:hypothetical protein